MMKCSCCGKKRRLFESFENIGAGGAVCVRCSDILYRIHDAKTDNQKEEYNLKLNEVNKYIGQGKASSEFKIWFLNDFMKRNAIQ